MNGITLVVGTTRRWPNGVVKRSGIIVRVYWCHPGAELGKTWVLPQSFDGTAHGTRRRQGARPARARPRRRCRSMHRGGGGHAEVSGGLGDAGRRRKLMLTTVGCYGWLCQHR